MKKRDILFVVLGIVVSIIIAMFISPFASSFPDGLEKVAENFGFIEKAKELVIINFIIPDYSFPGIGSDFWQTALAGFFGVLIVLAVFGIIFLIYRLVRKSSEYEDNVKINNEVG